MWTAQTEALASGYRYRVLQDGRRLAFSELFALLAQDAAFARWYSRTLADSPYAAYYWEHPPFTRDRFSAPAEFVLIDAPALARLPPDPAPFRSRFDEAPDVQVICFANLGGDARLIVPTPQGPEQLYPHLAAFVRGAADSQLLALWRETAAQVDELLGTTPRWLSTAGLGVAWLHLRLDTRPKYYSHAPYRRLAPPASGQSA